MSTSMTHAGAAGAAGSDASSNPVVLVFNQITDTFLHDMQKNGWVAADGVPTGVVDFYVSASPFNLSYTKDSKAGKASPKVIAFVDAITKAGRAYSLPPYGDVLEVLAKHPLAKNSVIPFVMGVDDFVVAKSKESWGDVAEWLKTCGFPDAQTVIDNGSRFLTKAHEYIVAKGDSINEADHRAELLVPELGADWRARSENLSKFKFLRLFGASDELLNAFGKAVVVSRGKSVELAHEARFIANFINLFKPTTHFKVGAISDILNFTAMLSGQLAPQNPTDQDSVRFLNGFEEKSITENAIARRVTTACFDMEPDDMGVLTAIKKYFDGVSVICIYPTQELADAAESYLTGRVAFSYDDRVLIDPLLGNSKALSQVYLAKSLSSPQK